MSDDALGTLHEVDGRMMLRFERYLAHPPQKVWRLITEPEGLARWFPARVRYDRLEVGSAMTFTFAQDDLDRASEQGVEGVPLESPGVIRIVDRTHVFEFEWLGEPVRFELQAAGDGCLLVFTHVFDRDEAQAPRNAAGWHFCLAALAASLDGRPLPPESTTASLQATYAAALG